jgi:hypothetical protein
MNRLRPLLLSLVLVATVASAHQDRILTLSPDGSIPEIPAPLGPVSLEISGLGGRAPIVVFRSGKHANTLPPCVTQLIPSTKASQVEVTGSWYHEESILPYYVGVAFHEPGYVAARSYNSSLYVLFNLRTTEVIRIHRFEAERSGNGGRYLEVDLPADCNVAKRAAQR